jgi:acyl carrier protein phosphodiesterase
MLLPITHIATKEAKKIFKPSVGLYAGAFTDVVYDHFIALDKNEFPTTEAYLFLLKKHIVCCYKTTAYFQKFFRK